MERGWKEGERYSEHILGWAVLEDLVRALTASSTINRGECLYIS